MDFSSGLTRPDTRRSWHRPPGGHSAGFTLIELIVVVVIVGIFAAIAVPSFSALIHRNSVRAAADELYDLLQYSRAEAVTRGTSVTIAPPGNSSANWAGNITVQIGQTVLRQVGTGGLQSGVAVTTNLGSIVFSPTSTSSASGCFQITYASDAAIATQFISLSSSGRVTAPTNVRPGGC